MFTGLIKEVGLIKSIQQLGNGLDVEIECSTDFANDIIIGDSISVNGVCSTAIKKTTSSFIVQYLEETLKKTTMSIIKETDIVNLEPCLTLQTKLGGHLVSGHVDDKGKITNFTHDGEWGVITISFNESFAPFIIPKGSIAIDGISLTVVDANKNSLSCHLIPHTQENTNLHKKAIGDYINLEFDQVGKYLFRFNELKKNN